MRGGAEKTTVSNGKYEDFVARIWPPRMDSQSLRTRPLLLPFVDAGAALDVVVERDPDTGRNRHSWWVHARTEPELRAQIAQLEAAMPGITVEYPVDGSDPGSIGADERAVGVALNSRDEAISVTVPPAQDRSVMLAALIGGRVLEPGERLIIRLHGQRSKPKDRERIEGRRESLGPRSGGSSGWLPSDVYVWLTILCVVAFAGYAAWEWLVAASIAEVAAVVACAVGLGLGALTVWRSQLARRIRAPKLPDHLVDAKLSGTLVRVSLEVLAIGPADADLRALRATVKQAADVWRGRVGGRWQLLPYDPRRAGYPKSPPARWAVVTEQEAGALYPSPLAVPMSQGTERGGARRLPPEPGSGHDGIDIGCGDG